MSNYMEFVRVGMAELSEADQRKVWHLVDRLRMLAALGNNSENEQAKKKGEA